MVDIIYFLLHPLQIFLQLIPLLVDLLVQVRQVLGKLTIPEPEALNLLC